MSKKETQEGNYITHKLENANTTKRQDNFLKSLSGKCYETENDPYFTFLMENERLYIFTVLDANKLHKNINIICFTRNTAVQKLKMLFRPLLKDFVTLL